MKDNKSIILTFTGDILSTRSQNKRAYIGKGKYDFSSYFSKLKYFFKESDYVIGSLETPIAGKGAKYTDSETCFNTPDEFLKALKNVGFKMLTTATNHCLDRGIKGLYRTINQLDKIGLDHTGTFIDNNDSNFLLKDFEGIKVAFISYTYGTNSASNGCLLKSNEEVLVNLTRKQDSIPKRSIIKNTFLGFFGMLPYSFRQRIRPYSTSISIDSVKPTEIELSHNKKYTDGIKTCINSAKQKADIVIFCLHSGGQFNSEIGEYTSYLVDLISSLGVDAIIGNHTHTVLPIKNINGCHIAYSLGNFAFSPKEQPYIDGVYADYSIALDLIIDKESKSISQINYRVLKNITPKEGLTEVVPVYDLYVNEQNEKVKEDIEQDIKQVIRRFIDRPLSEIMVERKYKYL